MNTSIEKTKVLFFVTVPACLIFLTEMIYVLKKQGFEIGLVSSETQDDRVVSLVRSIGIKSFDVPFKRKISLRSDLNTFVKSLRILRGFRPQMVVSFSPKASLVGMVSAKLLRIPARVYLLAGLGTEDDKSIGVMITRLVKTVIYRSSKRILCDSRSALDLLLKRCPSVCSRSSVPGYGSIGGVDAERFSLSQTKVNVAKKIATKHSIPQDAFVLGFVGRFIREKGIVEIKETFESLLQAGKNVHLLMIGYFDQDSNGGSLDSDLIEYLQNNPKITVTGLVPNVEDYLALVDLLIFPSHNEGFGVCVIEAASMGIPCVGFNVTGVKDSVANGVTGTLIERRDWKTLPQCVEKYMDDAHFYEQTSSNARRRVIDKFQKREVLLLYLDEYRKALEPVVGNFEWKKEALDILPPMKDKNERDSDFIVGKALKYVVLKGQDPERTLVSLGLNKDEKALFDKSLGTIQSYGKN